MRQRVDKRVQPHRGFVAIDPRRKIVSRLIELSFGLPERCREPVTSDPSRRGPNDSLDRRRMLRIVDLKSAMAGCGGHYDRESESAHEGGAHARPRLQISVP